MSVRAKILRKVVASDLFETAVSLVTGTNRNHIKRLRDNFLIPQDNLSLVIAALGSRTRLSIVQVGANDGKTGDPVFSSIHRYAARALLIEPQPWLISELRANYAGFSGELIIQNIAIGNQEGELELYVLRRDLWDEYIQKVGRHPSAIFSPDQAQLLRRITPRLGLTAVEAEAAIEKILVPVEPLKKIMESQGFVGADVVQIDCEGWDFEVIKSLGDIRPPIINFESFNLSEQIWQEFLLWSETNGYGFIRGPHDTLAIFGFAQRVGL